MNVRFNQNRAFMLLLAAVSLLHVMVLSIPIAQQAGMAPSTGEPVRVRLVQAPAKQQPPPEDAYKLPPQPVRPEPPEPRIEQRPAPVLAELPQAVATPPENPPITQPDNRRVLSWQFDYDTPDSIFGPPATETDERPDFYIRSRPGLEQALNAPSLQLPFADTRMYLVDSYGPGIGGSVERFFDNVTVPFGFTTRNNTRVQCGWILIVAGCSWGHTSLFEQKARRRP